MIIEDAADYHDGRMNFGVYRATRVGRPYYVFGFGLCWEPIGFCARDNNSDMRAYDLTDAIIPQMHVGTGMVAVYRLAGVI